MHAAPADSSAPAERRLVPKPAWLVRFERALAARVPVHPNLLSAAKLVLVTPALLLTLDRGGDGPASRLAIAALLVSFALLDYLDGLVARQRGLASDFGRFFDRLTDYPLIVAITWRCAGVLPIALVAVKLGLDLLVLLLFALGRGSTENRIRTAGSYTTLLTLLALSRGWLPGVATPLLATSLLALGACFTAIVALHNLEVLQKRFIADLLSLGNLACGVSSIVASARGQFEVSLLLLLLGATCDGLDGAAARRWGSTRWGVLSDDVADAVNFALAPGCALAFALGGPSGLLVGACFTLFTAGRLVYFTLRKGEADPRFFDGVPSTVGALIATSAVILLRGEPVLVGLAVGAACAQMVAFPARYRHLGRLFAAERRWLFAPVATIAALAVLAAIAGPHAAVAGVLSASLAYALLPTLQSFVEATRRRFAPAHS